MRTFAPKPKFAARPALLLKRTTQPTSWSQVAETVEHKSCDEESAPRVPNSWTFAAVPTSTASPPLIPSAQRTASVSARGGEQALEEEDDRIAESVLALPSLHSDYKTTLLEPPWTGAPAISPNGARSASRARRPNDRARRGHASPSGHAHRI